MTIYSADEIHKALSLYTKCRDANDRSGGKLFDSPMDEEIPSNLAVLADYNKVFDALIDEGVLNDRPNGEELEKFIRGLLPPKAKPEIHYYEVYFGDRESYGDGEQPSICIKGIRQPSVEEANEFCKVDSYLFGQPVTEVVEINGDYAENCFNMGQNLPVFGIDAPKSLADAGFAKWEFPLFVDVTIARPIAIYAKTQDEALSAAKEAISANPKMVFAHMAKCVPCAKFIAADHGGLEPLPPDAI